MERSIFLSHVTLSIEKSALRQFTSATDIIRLFKAVSICQCTIMKAKHQRNNWSTGLWSMTHPIHRRLLADERLFFRILMDIVSIILKQNCWWKSISHDDRLSVSEMKYSETESLSFMRARENCWNISLIGKVVFSASNTWPSLLRDGVALSQDSWSSEPSFVGYECVKLIICYRFIFHITIHPDIMQ